MTPKLSSLLILWIGGFFTGIWASDIVKPLFFDVVHQIAGLVKLFSWMVA